MGSEVTPRPKPELTGDRKLCIGELDRHGIRRRESDRVVETPARCRVACANRAEQILRALSLLF
jgi:hypothetical protein